jgi:predicted cupin superfamily sugar epimerase
MKKEEIIKSLMLTPHPEGGYYRRTFKTESIAGTEGPKGPNGELRGYATAIYYLSEGKHFSRWHKTDGDELWLWHAGAPLTLEIKDEDEGVVQLSLGPDLMRGEEPQRLAPKNTWQRAKSLGDWTLVTCSVSPGFLFETFVMQDE